MFAFESVAKDENREGCGASVLKGKKQTTKCWRVVSVTSRLNHVEDVVVDSFK